MLLGTHGPATYDAELHLLITIRKDQNTDKSVTGLGFPPGWLAMRRLRMTANGSSTLNSTASWMWRACLRKEWSLRSCLSRCVSLLVLPSIDSPSNTCCPWCSRWFAVTSGPREFDPGPLPCPRRDPAAPGCPAPAVSIRRQSTSHLEPRKRLPCRPPAQSNPAVHQGGWGLWVRPNPGTSKDQFPGRDSATGVEDGVDEEAAHGGGADVGDVDQGGNVCHQGKHRGEVVPPPGSGPASGHAEIHDHHQGVAWIWIHAVWRGGRSMCPQSWLRRQPCFACVCDVLIWVQFIVRNRKNTLSKYCTLSGLAEAWSISYQCIPSCQFKNSCVCVSTVQRRRLPSWSLAKCERWKCVSVQERGTQTTGDFPVWAHHFLRRSAALHLQDHCGRERDVLRDTTGTSSFLWCLHCAGL